MNAQAPQGFDLTPIRRRFLENLLQHHDSLEEFLEKMSKAGVGESDLKDATASLHRIAGSAGTLGFSELGALALEAEEIGLEVAKGDNPEQTAGAFRSALDRFLDFSYQVCVEQWVDLGEHVPAGKN